MAGTTRTEEFTVDGDKVVSKVKELLNEGSIRSISLKSEGGKTLLQVPLTIGVGAVALAAIVAPLLIAIAAVLAVVTKVSIVVEREVSVPASTTTIIDANR